MPRENQEKLSGLWLNETNGMTGAHVLSMEYDNYGNIWAGTDGDGVNIINLNYLPMSLFANIESSHDGKFS